MVAGLLGVSSVLARPHAAWSTWSSSQRLVQLDEFVDQIVEALLVVLQSIGVVLIQVLVQHLLQILMQILCALILREMLLVVFDQLLNLLLQLLLRYLLIGVQIASWLTCVMVLRCRVVLLQALDAGHALAVDRTAEIVHVGVVGAVLVAVPKVHLVVS